MLCLHVGPANSLVLAFVGSLVLGSVKLIAEKFQQYLKRKSTSNSRLDQVVSVNAI